MKYIYTGELDKLEGFGFEYQEDFDGWSGLGFEKFYSRDAKYYTTVGIDIETKELRSNFDDYRSLTNKELKKVIKDLFKAGLVEKQ
jgi:hypothetical protein